MKKLFVIALLFGLWTVHSSAHAEGGCPPGQIPYSGTNTTSCGPIPGYNQQQSSSSTPPARWESRWGAIATDSHKGALGTASGMTTQEGAEERALKDCRAKGGTQCEIDVSYDNSCAAMVMGDRFYSVKTGYTAERAIRFATESCSAGDRNCRVYYHDCSPAQRIQ